MSSEKVDSILTDFASSLAFSSSKPSAASILCPAASVSDQIPSSKCAVVTSPLSPAYKFCSVKKYCNS